MQDLKGKTLTPSLTFLVDNINLLLHPFIFLTPLQFMIIITFHIPPF
jgi:hypothetical protein